jgi:dienelactone hydrolase
MPLSARTAWAAGLAAAVLAVAAGAGEVTFPSTDGTLLKAHVFEAEQRPVRGTVVALHGCSGLYASVGPRKGLLSARHQSWADLLVAEGYAVVFPDSLTPRGETEICTQQAAGRRVGQAERRSDAFAALAWAAAQPWAAGDRMALLGWSHGGSAVLAATDAARRDVRAQQVRPVVAIAFYPGCSA